MTLSGSRPANHHRLPAGGDCPDQPRNRVFERRRSARWRPPAQPAPAQPAPHPAGQRPGQRPPPVAQHRGRLRRGGPRQIGQFPGLPGDRLGAFLPAQLGPGAQPGGQLPHPPAAARRRSVITVPAAPPAACTRRAAVPACPPPWPAAPHRSGRPRSRRSPWYRPAPAPCAAAWPRPPWPTAPRSARPPRPPRTGWSASSASSDAAPWHPGRSGRTAARRSSR